MVFRSAHFIGQSILYGIKHKLAVKFSALGGNCHLAFFKPCASRWILCQCFSSVLGHSLIKLSLQWMLYGFIELTLYMTFLHLEWQVAIKYTSLYLSSPGEYPVFHS